MDDVRLQTSRLSQSHRVPQTNYIQLHDQSSHQHTLKTPGLARLSGNLELSLPKSARYMPGCSKSSCTCPIFWRYKAATLGNVRGATPASPSATAPEPSGAGPSADFSHEVGRTKWDLGGDQRGFFQDNPTLEHLHAFTKLWIKLWIISHFLPELLYPSTIFSTSQSQKLWGRSMGNLWPRPRFGVDFHQGLRQINYQCLAMSCSSFKQTPKNCLPCDAFTSKTRQILVPGSFRRWENLHQQSHTLPFNSLHSPDIANLLPSDLELRNHRVTKGPTTASKKSEW